MFKNVHTWSNFFRLLHISKYLFISFFSIMFDVSKCRSFLCLNSDLEDTSLHFNFFFSKGDFKISWVWSYISKEILLFLFCTIPRFCKHFASRRLSPLSLFFSYSLFPLSSLSLLAWPLATKSLWKYFVEKVEIQYAYSLH